MLTGILAHVGDIAHAGGAALPPVERLDLAGRRADGIIVDETGEHRALFGRPLDVFSGVLDEVLVEEAVDEPLGLSELFLHDDGLLDLDTLLLLELRVNGKGSLDALTVAAQDGLTFNKDGVEAVLASLGCGGEAGEAAANNEQVGVDGLGHCRRIDDDARAVDGLDVGVRGYLAGRGAGNGHDDVPGPAGRCQAGGADANEVATRDVSSKHVWFLSVRQWSASGAKVVRPKQAHESRYPRVAACDDRVGPWLESCSNGKASLFHLGSTNVVRMAISLCHYLVMMLLPAIMLSAFWCCWKVLPRAVQRSLGLDVAQGS